MDDVFLLADRITVLRDGRTITSNAKSETDKQTVINHMVGRELNQIYNFTSKTQSDVLLEVEGLSKQGLLKDITFSVRKGEIVGIAGLIGSGRTELAYHIYGLIKPDSGEIRLRGKEISNLSPSKAMALGIGMVPEDRKELGLFLNMSIQKNVSATLLWFLNVFSGGQTIFI